MKVNCYNLGEVSYITKNSYTASFDSFSLEKFKLSHSGRSRGRVGGEGGPNPPIRPDACLRLKFLH